MLENQTFQPPPIIGVGFELFFDDVMKEETLDFHVVDKFRTVIQCPGFFRFALVSNSNYKADGAIFMLKELGIKFSYIQFFPPSTNPKIILAMVNAMEFVYSPTLLTLAMIPNGKVWPHSKEQLVTCLEHFNRYPDVYSAERFLAKATEL